MLATRDFVRECLTQAAAPQGRDPPGCSTTPSGPSSRPGKSPRDDDRVAIRSEARPLAGAEPILGYEEREENGRRVRTETPKDYPRQLMHDFAADRDGRPPLRLPVPGLASARSSPRSSATASTCRSCARTSSWTSRFTGSRRSASRSPRAGIATTSPSSASSPAPETRRVPAGTLMVKTAQPLGQPGGLPARAALRGRPGHLEVLRRTAQGRATISRSCGCPEPTPIADDRRRTAGRRPQARLADHLRHGPGRFPRRGGSSRARRSRRHGSTAITGCRSARASSYKVEAATGRSRPFVDPAALAKGSEAACPASTARPPSRSPRAAPRSTWIPPHKGFLFKHDDDLYYATFDGSTGGPADRSSGRGAVCPVQPRRPLGGLHPRLRPLRRRHRRPRRSGPSPPAGAETLRHGDRRLGLLRGDLQPPLAGLLVEPRLEEDRLHGVRRRRRSARSRCSTTPESRARSSRTSIPASGEPNPKVRLGIVGCQGRAGAVGRPVGLLGRGVPDQPRRLVARQLPRPTAYVQDRTQTWLDLRQDRRGRAAARSPNGLFRDAHQGLDRRPGADHVPQGRLVPLDSASATAGSTSTTTRPTAPSRAGSPTASGRSARSHTSTPTRAGSTSRRPATAPMATEPLPGEARRRRSSGSRRGRAAIR